MLWLGSGARRAGAAVHKLLDLGFTMLNSINGKGTVSEEHPMNLGGLHGNGMPKVQQFYQTVDLMLAVGTRLRGQETGDFADQAAVEHHPDRRRSAGQRPHLRQHAISSAATRRRRWRRCCRASKAA